MAPARRRLCSIEAQGQATAGAGRAAVVLVALVLLVPDMRIDRVGDRLGKRNTKDTISAMDGSGQARTEGQILDVDALPSGSVVTQHEAARYLGVSPTKIGWLVYRKYLIGNSRVVTVDSLRKEKEWRATAPRARKMKRRLRGPGHFFREFLLEVLDPTNWF